MAILKKTFLFLLLVFNFAQANQTDENCRLALKNRYEAPLLVLANYFQSGQTVDETIDRLIKDDVRLYVFKLEAIFRIYKDVYGGPFEFLLKAIKSLEDALGRYSAKQSFVERARRYGAHHRAISYLEAEEKKAHKKLEKLLLKGKWLLPPGVRGTSRLDDISALLGQIQWNYKEDKKHVLE